MSAARIRTIVGGAARLADLEAARRRVGGGAVLEPLESRHDLVAQLAEPRRRLRPLLDQLAEPLLLAG